MQVSPQKTPQVVGKLLDLECNEEVIKNLLNNRLTPNVSYSLVFLGACT